MRCGKCFSEEFKIRKLVHDGKYPSWVIDIFIFLRHWNIKFIISSNNNKVTFHILDVPENLREIVSEKAIKLGLVFNIMRDETKRISFEIKEA